MSAQEKILQGILDDANLQAEKTLNDAAAVCEEIKAQTAEMVKSYSATTTSGALLRAKSIKENAESAANLIVRDAKLAKRHNEIEKTLILAEQQIAALPDNEYFTLLTKLAKQNAKPQTGELLLCNTDLARNTEIFANLLKGENVNVKISSKAANITSGFILKYGDIEYNLTIKAVINDKREILEDKINTILFAE